MTDSHEQNIREALSQYQDFLDDTVSTIKTY